MCPECDNKTQVKSTKLAEEIILRRRQCVKCESSIVTLELIVFSNKLKCRAVSNIDAILKNIKNHGIRSMYRDLANGIHRRISNK